MKIVVSGGFTAERITAFESAGVPVDAYGVGSSLLRGANDFTADVVMVDGRPCGKVGRELRPNPRLSAVRCPHQRHEAHAVEPGAQKRPSSLAHQHEALVAPASTGATSRPPGASWASSAGGMRRGAAAATLIAS